MHRDRRLTELQLAPLSEPEVTSLVAASLDIDARAARRVAASINALAEGVPVIGFTWYSLQDQVDWDIQLREIRGNVNQNGLYDLDRKPHPAAAAFKELAQKFGTEPLLESFPTISLTGTSVLKSHASHNG